MNEQQGSRRTSPNENQNQERIIPTGIFKRGRNPNMKTRNRLLAAMLALVMIISMLPVSAFAENDAPATGTDIAIEKMDGKEEDTAKEGGSPAAPGELPGTGEGKEQGEDKGGEDKTAESTPTPEPSKAPAKKAAPAQDADDETPPAVSFTVTFDANGHGTAPDAVTVNEGDTISEPVAPTEDGWTFTGWFLDREATIAWDFNNDTVTDHTTLYAGWEGNTPAPTRSGMLRNGGTKSEKPPEGITFNIEVISRSGSDGDWRVGDKGKATATVRPEDACKDVIWEAYPEDIVEIDKDGYFTIIKQYDHSGFEYITIYVESLDGSVYHYAQIGRLAPADSNYWSNAIEAVEISECPNADGMWREGNEGQASVRWKSGVTPRTVTWSASTGENVDIEIDSDGKFRVTRKDLYSQTNVYITATFNVNGVDYSCRSNAIKVFKDKKNVTAVKLIKSPTKLSYVIGEMFDYTGLEVELTYHDGTTGTSVNGEGFHYQPGQDGDWWGPRNTPFQYGDNRVAITYTPYYGDSGTGTIIFNIQVSIPPTYTVSVTNDGNGTGEANPTSGTQGTEVTLTATPNSGYKFDRWVVSNANGGTLSGVTDNPAIFTIGTGHVTIRATFAEDPNYQYAITYHLDGGTNNAGNPATYTKSDTITLADPEREGFTFGGWYYNASFSGSPVTGIPVNSTGDKTFWAKWTAETYTISYNNLNGASNSNPTTYTIADTPITLAALTGGATGYTFDGWYDNASFSGSPVTGIPANSTGDKMFYAKWTAETYTIGYNNLNGASNSNPTTYTVADTITLAALPSVTGYTFDGWYDNASFSGSPVTGIPANSTGDKTFYAKWALKDYKISYKNLKGATNSNPTTYTIEDATITLVPPTDATGYTFDGWYDAAGNKVTTFAGGTTGDLSLEARWTADISDSLFSVMLSQSSYPYDGTPHMPTVTIADSSANLTEGTDYTVTPPADTKSTGEKTITISGTGTYNTDGTRYTGTKVVTYQIVKGAAPTLTFPTAAGIVYGQTLADSVLTGGSTEYGTFAWEDPSATPDAGSPAYNVIFTPSANTEQYYEPIPDTDKTKLLSVMVSAATPAVTISVEKNNATTASFTATVQKAGQGKAPTGSVKFEYSPNGTNWTDIASGVSLTEKNGNAEASTDWTFPVGDTEYQIRASYDSSTDNNYNNETATISFDPRKENQTGFEVKASSSNVSYGDTLRFTVSNGKGNGALGYTVSEPSVLTVDANGNATILKAGTVIVTAKKEGDNTYNAATASISVTVKKAELTFTAEDKTVNQGGTMPAFTFKTTGLVSGDTVSTDPVLTTTAADTNTAGTFDIQISGGAVTTNSGAAWTDCYDVIHVNSKLMVKALYSVTVTASPSAGGTVTGGGTFTE